jgi:hypothetical protein
MTQDDVILMAREAKLPNSDLYHGNLEAFAKLIAEHERQRLHDKFMQIHEQQKHSNNYFHFAARKIKEEE